MKKSEQTLKIVQCLEIFQSRNSQVAKLNKVTETFCEQGISNKNLSLKKKENWKFKKEQLNCKKENWMYNSVFSWSKKIGY